MAKSVDTIVDDLAGVRQVASKTGQEINDGIMAANKELSGSIRSLNGHRKLNVSELDRIHRNIINQEKLEPEKQIRSVLDALKERRSMLVQEVEIQTNQLNDLSKVLEASITPGQEGIALNILEQSGVDGIKVVPGVLQWKSQITNVFRKNKKVMDLTSKHIGNDTRFLQEFITLKRNPMTAGKLELWAANPKNFNKLESLMSKDKIFDIVSAGKLTMKQKLFGVTLKDQAKRLGLGTALVGAATGAIGVYNWMGDTNPSKISYNSKAVSKNLNIPVTGEGQEILRSAQQAIVKIDKIAAQANIGFGEKGSEKAAANFITGTSAELNNISNALNNWHLIVQNSPNPQQAMMAGKSLATYAQSIVASLNKLRSSLGASVSVSKEVEPSSIKELQAALDIDETGKLDNQTVSKLQSMENELNARKNTTRFTGLFVNPVTKQVIPLNYLQSVYKKFM